MGFGNVWFVTLYILFKLLVRWLVSKLLCIKISEYKHRRSVLGGDVRQLVYISAGKQLIRSCGNTESLGESLSELHPRIAHSFN